MSYKKTALEFAAESVLRGGGQSLNEGKEGFVNLDLSYHNANDQLENDRYLAKILKKYGLTGDFDGEMLYIGGDLKKLAKFLYSFDTPINQSDDVRDLLINEFGYKTNPDNF